MVTKKSYSISYPLKTLNTDQRAEMIRNFFNEFFPYEFNGAVQICNKNSKGFLSDTITCRQLSDRHSRYAVHTGDQYITVNIKKDTDKKRTIKDFDRIAGLPFDIDIHTSSISSEERERIIREIIDKIEYLIGTEIIPVPTMVIYSGRGIQVHYRFPEPVSTEKYSFTHAVWKKICEKLESLLGDQIEMDYSVGDIPRIVRIPGTVNTKSNTCACMLLSSGQYYTPSSLCSLFGFNEISVMEEAVQEERPKKNRKISGNIKKAVRKKIRKEKNSEPPQPKKAERVEWTTEKEAYEKGEKTLGCIGVDRKIKEMHLNALLRLMDIRKNFTGCRDLFLHLLYNHYIWLMSKPEADARILRDYSIIMGKSDNTFSIDELYHIIDTFWTNPYDYKVTESIVSKLGMTDEEITACGLEKYAERKTRKETAEKNNELRAMKRYFCRYFRAMGLKHNEIVTAVNKELGLSSDDLNACSIHYVHRYARGVKKGDVISMGEISVYVHEKKQNTVNNTAQMFDSKKNEQDFLYREKNEKMKNESSGNSDNPIIGNNSHDRIIPVENMTGNSTVTDVMNAYLEGKNVLVLGKGGTGKSQLIRDIQHDCKSKGARCITAAPTNMAADNINGKTIHSVFRLKWADGYVYPMDEEITASDCKKLKGKNIVIIIDECMNIRADYMHRILQVIHKAEELNGCHIQLICMGDGGQIAPVCTDGEMEKLLAYGYTSEWVNDLEEWNSIFDGKIHLTHCFRIADEEYSRVLDDFRTGYCPDEDLAFINGLSHTEDVNSTYIAGTHRSVRMINLMCMGRGFAGHSRMHFETTDGPYDFALGMKVMVTKNYSHNIKNGYRGVIKSMSGSGMSIALTDSNGCKGKVVRVEVTDGILPVVPGYAMTIHKAQGQTFDTVNILPEIFEAGQLYTALSRVRSREGIHILGTIRKSDIRVNEKILKYQYMGM